MQQFGVHPPLNAHCCPPLPAGEAAVQEVGERQWQVQQRRELFGVERDQNRMTVGSCASSRICGRLADSKKGSKSLCPEKFEVFGQKEGKSGAKSAF